MKKRIARAGLILSLMSLMVVAGIGATTYNRVPSSEILASSYGDRTGHTLTNAISKLGTREVALVVDGGKWTVTNNVTWPTNIFVVMAPGSYFYITSGVTMTFQTNWFFCGYQVAFSGDGNATGKAQFLYRWTQWGDTGDFNIGNGVLGSNVTTDADFTMADGTTVNLKNYTGGTGDVYKIIVDQTDGGTGNYYALSFSTGDVDIVRGKGSGGTVDVYRVDASEIVSAAGGDVRLDATTNAVIFFTNTQTYAAIKAKIESMNKFIPADRYIIFQFRNGDYFFTNSLVFEGFYGGGGIYIYGDTTEADNQHTNQAVSLIFTNAASHGLEIRRNGVAVQVDSLDVWIQNDTGAAVTNYRTPIYVLRNRDFVRVQYSYLRGQTNGYGRGITISTSSSVQLTSNVFDGVKSAICGSQNSGIYCRGCVVTNIAPQYGWDMRGASYGATWGQFPTGTVANTYTNYGGGFIDD